jgi:hypothetical protein
VSVTEWRPVAGYEGLYEVSDDGQVRSLPRPGRLLVNRSYGGRVVMPGLSRGYKLIGLSRDGERRNARIHVLVAGAFLGPRPDGMDVCHNDGNKANNAAVNLRYGSRSENSLDKRRHGTDPNFSKTHCPQGHEYDLLNTVFDKRGHRCCRECINSRHRRARALRRAQAT